MNKIEQSDNNPLVPQHRAFELWKDSAGPIMTIVESTPSGVCITDEQGLFEYVNPAFCLIYGYEPQELIGTHFTILVPESNRPWLMELHDKFIGGTNEVRGEWPVQNKAGEQLFILADAVRIVSSDGQFKKVTFVTDITARKKSEVELARSENLLREAVATKDKFFSIIAHDLKNSFQILIMGAELVMLEASSASSAEASASAKMMHQTSLSALDLLNNLLTWAQSQTGTIQCHAKELMLVTSVLSATQPLLDKALNKNILMKIDIPEKLSVYADHDMLNTVLFNLIGNALKFTGSGDSVTIAAHEEGPQVIVDICDTGVGMDKEILNQLFRIDSKNSSKGTDGEQGTGLGLLLCKEFVEINGGKIWVQSSEGKGATFSFSLPKYIAAIYN